MSEEEIGEIKDETTEKRPSFNQVLLPLIFATLISILLEPCSALAADPTNLHDRLKALVDGQVVLAQRPGGERDNCKLIAVYDDYFVLESEPPATKSSIEIPIARIVFLMHVGTATMILIN